MRNKPLSFLIIPVITFLLATILLLTWPITTLQAQVGVSQNQAQAPVGTTFTNEELENYKTILKPARYDETDDKIEVVTFFWYGCRSCRDNDAMIDMFTSSLPDDVRSLHLPALFDSKAPFQTHGRLFLVLDELGVEDRVRQAAFDTAQQINNPKARGYGLVTRESQETFAVSQGVARSAFNKAYDSPAVLNKEAKIKTFLDNSDLTAVPSMVINGRYTIEFFNGPGYYQLAEKLINLERARLAKDKLIIDKAKESKNAPNSAPEAATEKAPDSASDVVTEKAPEAATEK